MRLLSPLLGLALTLAACDLPDIGDSDSTTSGGDPGPVTESSTTVASASASASATSAAPTDATTATAGGACPPFDPGPVGDPHETYQYECFCESCQLSYEDIPLETLQLFENEGLCECLCAEAGCGGVEGEGGVATGSPTDTGPGDDCGDTEGWGSSGGWGSDTATTGSWPDTDGGTTDWGSGGVTTDATYGGSEDSGA